MKNKSLWYIHSAVFLFGASGLFIKLIPMPAMILTLGRALFSAIALYLYVHFRHISLHLYRKKDAFLNLLAGIFLTIHWFFFILSVQVSKVYIGTITFATYPMFVVFIEPYAFKEKFQFKNLLLVLMISSGIGFLIPSFQLDNQTTLGIFYGLISSLSFAILSVINRKLVASYESVVITLYEQMVASIIMTLGITMTTPTFIQGDSIHFIELVVYGVVFTGLAHSLYIHGMKNVKAQTASIISVLEPVYSIILSMLLLSERYVYQEIIGIVIILIAVIVSPIMNKDDDVGDVHE